MNYLRVPADPGDPAREEVAGRRVAVPCSACSTVVARTAHFGESTEQQTVKPQMRRR